MESSLYIHIPFCAGACDYCDFYSVPVRSAKNAGDQAPGGRMDVFIDSLLADIEDQFQFFGVEHVPTVYMGGGTPSVLGAARMERLLSRLGAMLEGRGPPGEFTVEVNPESIDEDFLLACRNGGVSRISLGLQSFHKPSRRAVHRTGAAVPLDKQLGLVSRYYPGAFSADLIAGLPLQTEAVLLKDIARLIAFKPVHVSLYSLTIEPFTPLARRVALHGKAALCLPDQDEADAVWLAGKAALENAGYRQYEVSNFAQPGGECLHNLRYWRMENWLGAGPAASGTIIDEASGTGRRFTYPSGIGAWHAAPRPKIRRAALEELDRDTLMRESILMGFRLRGGPDRALFMRRFDRDIAVIIPNTIDRWRRRGFFAGGGEGLALSCEGMLFLDAFLCESFGEMGKGE
ncbi:MAG: coproporphyrinogen III oxidase family protein [Treponema sp.]|jgi:oxygen-independent coproporphyrinogen-3 oxidase|nr:coproporphyrinogen III oxidase family protein [Treponema sp.]